MTPGVHHGMSNDAYQRGPGLSVSQVKRLGVSPFHMHALTQPRTAPPKAPTPAMQNGTRVHCALLEPDQFARRYIVGPDISKNSNAWKLFAAEAEAREQAVITQLEQDQAYAQAAALMALPEVTELLGEGEPEVSAYWLEDPDEAAGVEADGAVLCRCRPDHVHPVAHGSGVVLLDVKTAADASAEGFRKAVHNFGYHQQADWYCRGFARASGLTVHGMVFGVVESEFPHAAAVYMLSDAALLKARKANADALALFARCRAQNKWPGYPSGIQVIDLPPWA